MTYGEIIELTDRRWDAISLSRRWKRNQPRWDAARRAVNWRELRRWIAWHGRSCWNWWATGDNPRRNAPWWTIHRREAIGRITWNWTSWLWWCGCVHWWRNDSSEDWNWRGILHRRLSAWRRRKIDRNGVASKAKNRRWWQIDALGHHWWLVSRSCRDSHNDSLWWVGWRHDWLVWRDCHRDNRVCNDSRWNIRCDVGLRDDLRDRGLGLLWWHGVADGTSLSIVILAATLLSRD